MTFEVSCMGQVVMRNFAGNKDFVTNATVVYSHD